MEVAKEWMKSEKSNEWEVSHHFVERMATEISGNGVWVSSGSVHLQLFVDVTLVYHGVKNIQNL